MCFPWNSELFSWRQSRASALESITTYAIEGREKDYDEKDVDVRWEEEQQEEKLEEKKNDDL